MIRKEGSYYVLRSKRTGRNLGKFKTKKDAVRRERQVQYFKHRKRK